MALVFGTLLVLLFPTSETFQRWYSERAADHLSITYLELMVQSKPDDSVLRLTLARQLLAVGRLHRTRVILAPLVSEDTPAGTEALLLDLQAMLALSRAAEPGSDARRHREALLSGRIKQLIGRTYPEEVSAKLAAFARLAGAHGAATEMYIRLAKRTSVAKWWAEAGHTLLASSNAGQAANMFIAAMETEKLHYRAFEYTLQAIDALRSANRLREAMELAQRGLKTKPKSLRMLERALGIARATNHTMFAEELSTRISNLLPNDVRIIARHIEVLLSSGNLDAATVYSERLVKLRPRSVRLRKKLAKVAEWAGQPNKALGQWLWLLDRYPSEEVMEEVARIARAVWNQPALLKSLLAQAKGQESLPYDSILEITHLFEQVGNPEGAETFLTDQQKLQPNGKELWVLKARLQERMAHRARSIDTWEELRKHHGLKAEQKLHLAKLLWHKNRLNEAKTILQEGAPPGEEQSSQHWRTYGDLSFQLEDFTEARRAYDALLSMSDPDEDVSFRLFWLHQEYGDTRRALEVAKRSFIHSKNASMLLAAISLAINESDWKMADELHQLSKAHPELFEHRIDYWMSIAAVHGRQSRNREARSSLERALQLNPNYEHARSALLWLLLSSDDSEDLERYLALWRSDAWRSPILWDAYAAGYTRVGRHQEATRWFARQAPERKRDFPWLLGYGDALERAKNKTAAWRLRKHVFTQLARKKHRAKNQDLNKRDLLAYALSAQRLGRNREARQAVGQLVQNEPDDPEVAALNISLQIEDRRLFQAKRNLARLETGRKKGSLQSEKLTLALVENDLRKVEHIYAGLQNSLPPATRVGILTRLRKNARALSLALTSISTQHSELDNSTLTQQANGLIQQQPNMVRASLRYDQMEGLLLRDTTVATTLSSKDLSYSLKTAYFKYATSIPSLSLLDGLDEFDAEVQLSMRQKFGQTKIGAGLNLRSRSASILRGFLNQEYNPIPELTMSGSLFLGEVANESATIRSLATRDRVLLGLAYRPMARISLGTTGSWTNYSSRRRNGFGSGLNLDVELSVRILFDTPSWTVRLTGSAGRQQTPEALPSDLARILPSSLTPGALLPGASASVGVGTTLTRGEVGQVPLLDRPLRYSINLWGGFIWPRKVPSYSAEASIGIRVFGSDELSVNAYWANALGSLPTQVRRGIEARYVLRLWP